MSFADLDAMIATLRGLDGPDVERAIAARTAPLLDAAVKRTAAAGQDPDGKPWAPTKDGGAPLAHAADHITTAASGSIVRMTLTGPDVYHHFGATRGGIRRQVIPDAGAGIPQVAVAAITRAAREEIAARVGR